MKKELKENKTLNEVQKTEVSIAEDTQKIPTKEKTKKTSKRKVVKRETFLEIDGKQIDMKKVDEAVSAAAAKTFSEDEIKKIETYINVANGKVYYVVNDVASDEYCINITDI